MDQVAMLEEALRAAKEEKRWLEEEAAALAKLEAIPSPPPRNTPPLVPPGASYPARQWVERPIPEEPPPSPKSQGWTHFAPNPLKDIEQEHVLNAPSPLPGPSDDASLGIVRGVPGGPGNLIDLGDAERLLAQQGTGGQLIEEQFEHKRSEESIRTEISASAKTGSKELLTGDDIDLKTELNHKEIIAASRLLFMSERYEMPVFTHFVTNYLRLKVSKDRKGRREYIEGLHAEEKKEAGRDLSPLGSLLNTITGR
jgi:hypothetical protein